MRVEHYSNFFGGGAKTVPCKKVALSALFKRVLKLNEIYFMLAGENLLYSLDYQDFSIMAAVYGKEIVEDYLRERVQFFIEQASEHGWVY